MAEDKKYRACIFIIAHIGDGADSPESLKNYYLHYRNKEAVGSTLLPDPAVDGDLMLKHRQVRPDRRTQPLWLDEWLASVFRYHVVEGTSDHHALMIGRGYAFDSWTMDGTTSVFFYEDDSDPTKAS